MAVRAGWRSLVVAAIALVCNSSLLAQNSAIAPNPRPRQPVRYVVLVSVDGLAASYLRDPKADLKNLRRLADQGASADGMLTSFPSVTWPAHTSLITGTRPARHGVIGNAVWNRDKDRRVVYIGDPELTKDESIRVPTLYDAANAAGLTTASVIWPCSNGAKSLRWVIPDSNQPQLHARYTTPGFAEELAQAGIDISPLGGWGWGKQYSTARDILYTKVAQYLLEKHRVNLLLVHLITPDGVQHAYGPQTREAYAAVAESDQRIAEIWQTLQQPPFAGEAAMFVVSDHGFAPYEKVIRPNVVLRELGLVTTDADGKVQQRSAWCVGQGGSAFVYVLKGADSGDALATLKTRLGAIEGVTAVLDRGQFTQMGLPDPDKSSEAPHLVLTTGPGYSFNDAQEGAAVADAGGHLGSHGHDPAPAYMHATFVAAGSGIRAGTRLKTIRNIDVAPTIAHLMGFELESADGQVLTAILDH